MRRRYTRRFVAVLYTGTGPSFIRRDIGQLIRKDPTASKIIDENKHKIEFNRVIVLSVNVEGRVEAVHFDVFPRFSVNSLIGCDFCNKRVEEIRPRIRLFELYDCTTVPIVRRPVKGLTGSIPLLEEKQYFQSDKRVSNKI